MRRIISNSNRAGRTLSCGLILCLALSVLGSSWRGATSQASQHDVRDSLSDSSGGTDAPESNYTFTNSDLITIPSVGQGAPYPSTISVAGVPSTVDHLTVTLNGLTHSWVSDIDVLLVSPGGQSFVLMSDAGGITPGVTNVSLTFDDASANLVPDLPGTGIYRPTNNDTVDIFGAPAPGGPYQSPAPGGTATLTSTFGGTAPNGNWSLYVVDDTSGDAGMIAGGWSITITNSISAQNTQAIDFPSSGAATLYPSNLNVTGLIGSVTSVSVILNNFTHTSPDDVDLLLVAPGGRSVIVMSDVGGSNPVSNISLTLDDAAANSLPDSSTLTSGVYKPTNFEAGDVFPSPAPGSPPTGTTLSALNGINANGVWSLYAVDDAGGNVGSISGGWSIAINTSATACSLSLTPSLQVFPLTGGSGSFDLFSPFGCDWTATSLSSFVHITSGTSGAGGNSTLAFTVDPNMGAGRTGLISISTASLTRTFTVQQPSGCPFSLSQETVNFSSSAGAGNISVTAGGACGWEATTKDTWIMITAGTGTGNGSVSFTVAANNTGTERTGTVTIGARTLTIVQAGSPGTHAIFDFDGDGKSDYAVTRSDGGVVTWHLLQSANGATSQMWGGSSNVLVPGDYDGDGKWDLAVWQATTSGIFYILRSQTGTLQTVDWGVPTDDPKITQDFDGDGKADPSVTRYDNTTGLNWYIRESVSGNLRAVQFGALTDVPVRGDFDGDGKADIAVYRRNNGSPANTFYVLRSSNGAVQAASFGNYSLDYVLPADFDGDSKTDYAVWRGRSGGDSNWYWLNSSDNSFHALNFGIAGSDLPAPCDYDGDGKSDIAVWRPGGSATFYVNRSTAGFVAVPWGTSGDTVPAFTLQAR